MTFDTYVFPSTRSIRDFMLSRGEGFLPRLLTINDLFTQSMIYSHRIIITEEMRIWFYYRAFLEQSTNPLGLSTNFPFFWEQIQALISFYREIDAEHVSWEQLYQADAYTLYSEHIDFLQGLHQRFYQLLEEYGYSDITQGEIDHLWCENLGRCCMVVEGYLTQRELDIVSQIATSTPFYIQVALANESMAKKYSERGFDVIQGTEVLLDMTLAEVVWSKALVYHLDHTYVKETPTRLEQIGGMISSIHQWLQQGVLPEDIVVILPDESMSELIAILDKENNFNFAMGIPFSKTQSYQVVDRLYRKMGNDEDNNETYNVLLGVDELYCRISDGNTCVDILEEICEEHQDKLNTTFNALRMLLTCQTFEPYEVMTLFRQMVQGVTIDDTQGGRITVMGVLESRLTHYPYVILLDFNDGIVPSVNDKELFLSTDVRKYAKLPTFLDRQNLQLFYYQRLLSHAKESVIYYTSENNQHPSSLLRLMNLTTYESCSFSMVPWLTPQSYRQTSTEFLAPRFLSASSLHDFMVCKRRFYYRYCVHLISDDTSSSRVGTHLHGYLKRCFDESLSDAYERFLALTDKEKDPIIRFYLQSWAYQSEDFWKEQENFMKEGSILALEHSFAFEWEGITLKGIIDRVERTPQGLRVIDYKYKSRVKAYQENDFQLTIYALACQFLYQEFPYECAYYDLKNCSMVYENEQTDKIEQLKKVIHFYKEYDGEYPLCDEIKECFYCSYKGLCQR